ncbi:MAG: hypothetical protein R3E04_05780 [Sphingobium sp.]
MLRRQARSGLGLTVSIADAVPDDAALGAHGLEILVTFSTARRRCLSSPVKAGTGGACL